MHPRLMGSVTNTCWVGAERCAVRARVRGSRRVWVCFLTYLLLREEKKNKLPRAVRESLWTAFTGLPSFPRGSLCRWCSAVRYLRSNRFMLVNHRHERRSHSVRTNNRFRDPHSRSKTNPRVGKIGGRVPTSLARGYA